MFQEGQFYTPADVATALQVSVCSVYQSLPGQRCRPKLGKVLPEPIRFGRLIRWTGRQLIDFASPPNSGETAPRSETAIQTAKSAEVVSKRSRGRPRNVQAVLVTQVGGAS